MANSRVGVTIKAFIFRGALSFPFAIYSCCKIGIAKAAVFPVPVCAQPNKSLPLSTIGIEIA